jgi:hypothetical protein
MLVMSAARPFGAQSAYYEEIGRSPLARADALRTSTIGNVHRDFHTEPEINGLRGFPFHTRILRQLAKSGLGLPHDPILCFVWLRAHGIIMKLAS